MIDVEMHRAGKVTPAILRASIEIRAGVVPSTIKDAKARLRQMTREPLGAHQRFSIRIGHVPQTPLLPNSIAALDPVSESRQQLPPSGPAMKRGSASSA
jgi:hypothetical protein